MKTRHYLHGDEVSSGVYYCASCDTFEAEEHFTSQGSNGHLLGHSTSLEKFQQNKRNWIERCQHLGSRNKFFRPNDAPNLFGFK